jgi:hypothetical protein
MIFATFCLRQKVSKIPSIAFHFYENFLKNEKSGLVSKDLKNGYFDH